MKDLHWELSTLYEISHLLSGNPDLPDLVDTIAKAATAFGNADASWLAVCDEANGKPEHAASHRLSPESIGDLSDNVQDWLPFSVAAAGEPAVLTDLGKNAVLQRIAARESLSAAAVVPVTYNERLTGVLAVFWGPASRRISDHIEPVCLLANQVGPAIANARLLSEARRRAEAVHAIFNITQMIGASPLMSFALNVIMDEANRLFGTDQSTIRLIDSNTRELVVRASRGFSKQTLRRIRLKVGQGGVGWVAKHGKPLILNDAASDPRFSYYPEDAERVSSLMSAPLIVQGRTIGVLSMSSIEPKCFTEEDESLLMTLAGEAAIAIENARLYEQIRKRLSEQKVLYRLAQQLASTVDVPSALQLIVNHLSTSFRAKLGSLRLLNDEGTMLQIGAVYSASDEYIKLAIENEQMSLDPGTLGGRSPAAFAIRERRICAVSNIFKDRRFAAWRENARAEGYTSLVCVPLIPTETPIGVLSLYFRDARRLQPAEYELLQTAGRTAAIALQRAMLDERLLKEEVTRRALEEVSHLKTEFVSQVSHELRTPLTAIQGYVKLILAGHTGELNSLQEEFLGTVDRNTDRLVALVNDLLDISRIEAGKMDLVFESLDLAGAIDREIEALKAQAEVKEITILVDIEEATPRVRADPHRLGQIIDNLVSNAIKYSPGRSTVKITANPVGNNVLVKVIDCGIGIEPEERGKVFQRFYRAKNDLVRSTWGTGLGLAITRYLVEMHGGKIWVESEKGQGSTFSFSIAAVPDAGS
ncbi:MAG TPA: GAF domain-containing protein [Armatimonadota bacterium]|nr:GAF domain-containing protein [Armatimonadota bacterium]